MARRLFALFADRPCAAASLALAKSVGFLSREKWGLRRLSGSGILGKFQMPWMGLGGAMFRTWSGRGRSSHKGPLASAHAYPRHWCVQRGLKAPLFAKSG